MLCASSRVGAVPRSAHLWVASPVAPGATPDTDLGESASLDIRVDALREL